MAASDRIYDLRNPEDVKILLGGKSDQKSIEGFVHGLNRINKIYSNLRNALVKGTLRNKNDVYNLIKDLTDTEIQQFINTFEKVLVGNLNRELTPDVLEYTKRVFYSILPRLRMDINQFLVFKITKDVLINGVDDDHMNVLLRQMDIEQFTLLVTYFINESHRQVAKAELDGDTEEADELKAVSSDFKRLLTNIMREHISAGRVHIPSINNYYSGNPEMLEFIKNSSYGAILGGGAGIRVPMTLGDVTMEALAKGEEPSDYAAMVDISKTMKHIDEVKRSRNTRKRKNTRKKKSRRKRVSLRV
jgi:hypothetical protein